VAPRPPAIGQADRLTQANPAGAFRGELVPTEAELARREGRDYEPASALLVRIRAEREDRKGTSKERRTQPRVQGRLFCLPAVEAAYHVWRDLQMLTPKKASDALRKHFAEVTPEEFIQNVRCYSPELLAEDESETATGRAEAARPDAERDGREQVEMPQALIVSDPAVMMGKPVIAGTRLTVEFILEKLAAGETIQDLRDAHPRLTEEGIRAARAFAAEALRADVVCPVGG
jgi:uncharacterized protein (DUF433 family)